jgi:hypothetical protein
MHMSGKDDPGIDAKGARVRTRRTASGNMSIWAINRSELRSSRFTVKKKVRPDPIAAIIRYSGRCPAP